MFEKRLAPAVGTAVIAVAVLAPSAFGEGPEADLLAALPSSRQTLSAGISQAQAKAPEVSISTKFEMDDSGKLSLSVYTAGKGLGVDAEHNVLKELSGSPADKWTPHVEVFQDVPHVSRAAQQLAVMALSKLSLIDVVRKAEQDLPGTVYSVIPVLQDRKPLFAVRIASGGKSVELWYDALTGVAAKRSK